jgi:hypothetical protein
MIIKITYSGTPGQTILASAFYMHSEQLKKRGCNRLRQFIEAITEGSQDLIEIREIASGKKPKTLFFRPSEFDNYKPPQDKNVYFGVLGRKVRKGSKEHCTNTGVLWADWDSEHLEGCTTKQEQLNEVIKRIQGANIPEASMIIDSGNGVHAYWLLTERIGHEVEQVLKAMVKALNSDSSVAEAARIMRLPGTYNVKDPLDHKLCDILSDTGMIYDIEHFTKPLGVTLHRKALRVIYNHGLTIDRPCVASMLEGAEKGERNFALGRIVKYLQMKGYTKDRTQGIIFEWNKYCRPSKTYKELLDDFNRLWHSDYKLLGCKLDDPRHQAILANHCKVDECTSCRATGSIILDNATKYNNRMFSQYEKLKGEQLIILGVLLKYPQGLNREQLEGHLYSTTLKKACMDNRTLLKSLEILSKFDFIEYEHIATPTGKKNFNNYFAKAKNQGTYGTGYTIVSNGAIMGAVHRVITPTEFKLYVLLLKYAYQKGVCFPSSRTLAKDLGAKQPNVVTMISKLESQGYIERSLKDNKTNYRLLM